MKTILTHSKTPWKTIESHKTPVKQNSFPVADPRNPMLGVAEPKSFTGVSRFFELGGVTDCDFP